MRKIAYLHIGFPKTGSSTIQRFLKYNRKILEKRGYYINIGNIGLLNLIQNGELDNIIHDFQNLIFSDEKLGSRVSDESSAGNIVKSLESLDYDVKVIAFVRRSDEVNLSGYFTSLIGVGSKHKIQEIREKPQYYPHRQLSFWKNFVGESNISVMRFGSDYFNVGLVEDFCEIVGIDSNGLAFPGLANVSPRMDVLELIRQINILEPKWKDRRLRLKALARVAGNGPPIGMSRKRRAAMAAKLENDERYLSIEYFGGNPVFTHPFKDDDPGDFQLTPDHVISIMTSLSIVAKITLIDREIVSLNDAVIWAHDCLESLDIS